MQPPRPPALNPAVAAIANARALGSWIAVTFPFRLGILTPMG